MGIFKLLLNINCRNLRRHQIFEQIAADFYCTFGEVHAFTAVDAQK